MISNQSSLCEGLSLVAVLSFCSVAMASCDRFEDAVRQQCSRTEASYQQALDRETTELESSDELGEPETRPAHFGLTLSNELLSKLADAAAGPILEAALEIASTVRLGGQSVDLDTEGDVVDLKLAADDTCDHCFEVTVSLGGALVAENSTLGRRRAQLAGAVQFVAPLLVEEGDNKSAAVKLDLRKFAEYGVETVTAQVADPNDNISDDLQRRLRRPLSNLVERTLAERLQEKVTLVEFDGPSIGLDGFELTPVALKSDDQQGSVFAGFSANIAALNGESIAGVDRVTELGDGRDIALSFQPELILQALSLLMEGKGDDESVARSYDRAGRAVEAGSYRVVLQRFGTGNDAVRGQRDADLSEDAAFWGDTGSGRRAATDVATADAADVRGDVSGSPDRLAPFGLGFSIYRFNSGGVCFSAGARAIGAAGVRDGNLRVGIRDVRFTSEGVPQRVLDLANWTSAQFLEQTKSLVRTSVEGENLRVPGTSLGVGPLDIGLRPHTVVLRGRSETGEMDQDE